MIRRLPSVPEEAGCLARFCPHCGRPVVVPDARYCKECGLRLPGAPAEEGAWSWRLGMVAVGLSAVPGLGHFYLGRTVRAAAWFLVVLLGYRLAFSLGLVLHAACAVGALSYATAGAPGRGEAGRWRAGGNAAAQDPW